jgi:hypothetical protein
MVVVEEVQIILPVQLRQEVLEGVVIVVLVLLVVHLVLMDLVVEEVEVQLHVVHLQEAAEVLVVQV